MKKTVLSVLLFLLIFTGIASAETIHTEDAIEYSNILHNSYESSAQKGFRISSENALLEDNASRTLMIYYDGELSDSSAAYDICDEYGIHTLIYKTRDEADKAFAFYTENNYAVCRDELLCTAGYLSWGPERIGTPLFTKGLMEAYGSEQQMPRITVAVIDTGVDYNHSFLSGRVITSYDYDFYNNDNDAMDDNNHGTHVAGIIADNTLANVNILPIKVANSSGALTSTDLKSGIQYAKSKGVNIINMSIGAMSEDRQQSLIGTFSSLFKSLRQSGITVCVAAGNADQYGNKHNANYIFPAYMNDTIVVANLAQSDSISSMSNYGSVIDFSAPGSNINSTIRNNQYRSFSGTSMASPFAAAAAALLLTRNPSLTPTQIESELKSNTTPYSVQYEDDYRGRYGSGILNISNYYSGDAPATPRPTQPARPTAVPKPTPSPTHSPIKGLITKVTYDDNGTLYAVIENKGGILTDSAEAIAIGYNNNLPTGISYIMSVRTEGEETVFNGHLPNADRFEYIKLFVWDSFKSMKPLSLPLTVNVSKTDDGEYIVQTINR